MCNPSTPRASTPRTTPPSIDKTAAGKRHRGFYSSHDQLVAELIAEEIENEVMKKARIGNGL